MELDSFVRSAEFILEGTDISEDISLEQKIRQEMEGAAADLANDLNTAKVLARFLI